MPNRRPAETLYPLAGKRVWVAGHTGLVGAAVVRRLAREDCEVITPAERIDLRDQAASLTWVMRHRPQLIFLAAAKVGGILANETWPADFLADNLRMEMNVIDAARRADVEKLVFLGSSCIYPRLAPQPIEEDALLSGPLEPTNEAYAVAKIAGIKLCQAYRRQHGCDFISAMPTNLYGPGDNFDLASGHVLPALIRKAHEAKVRGEPRLVMWGTGSPRREFLHCDDCADALVHLAKTYSAEGPINVGTGEDISIAELTSLVARVVGFRGDIVSDLTKPDGTSRKLLEVSRLSALGWAPRIGLEYGVGQTYRWFLKHAAA